MTFAPARLVALGAYYTAQGGRNLGIVGDAAHVGRGVSYHLGADDLLDGAYSAVTPRDVAGLTNAASAIDLGAIDGSYVQLRAFSQWLVSRARANAPGTIDMREIIYSPDGVVVLQWDRERGYASLPRRLADTVLNNSHRTHTHISYYRDSQQREKVSVFQPYFEGSEAVPDFEAKIERWTLDGGPAKVTTLGAPKRADGTVDYAAGRLAYVTGAGGANPTLTLLARARLTAPTDDEDAALRANLAAYSPGFTSAEMEAAIVAARRAEWDRNNPTRP